MFATSWPEATVWIVLIITVGIVKGIRAWGESRYGANESANEIEDDDL